MSKEEYYSKIKKYIYRKFEELEVAERNDGNDIYLHYNNTEYAKILIQKKMDYVYYQSKYRDTITKSIGLEIVDFEILLKRWVEDTFQMNVKNISNRHHTGILRLKIPFI